MNTLKKLSNFFGQNMAVIVIAVAALALFAPQSVSFIKTSYVNTLLGIVMFGMGLTLKPGDFKVVFSRPKDVIIGCIAQFTVMPLLAFGLTKAFNLPPELAIGVILVGTCPGGTSSNVMTYLSKGDVALSVGMTAVSTVLAPFLTPVLTYVYAGARVDVNMASMFLSIVKVVIVPIAAGFIINHFFFAVTRQIVEILPLISTTAIVAIVAAVVSANASKILTSGLLIVAVVICHNVLGYLLGFSIGKALKLDGSKCRLSPLKSACRTPALQPPWPPPTLPSTLLPRFRAPCSVSGTIFPARCWLTSMRAQRKNQKARRSVENTAACSLRLSRIHILLQTEGCSRRHKRGTAV